MNHEEIVIVFLTHNFVDKFITLFYFNTLLRYQITVIVGPALYKCYTIK